MRHPLVDTQTPIRQHEQSSRLLATRFVATCLPATCFHWMRSHSAFRNLICLALVAVVGISFSNATSTAQDKPNIVLIELDDVSVEMFSDEMLAAHFPNLLDLKQEGLNLNNYHVVCPSRGPALASLLRGQFPSRSGMLVDNPTSRHSHALPGGYAHYHDQGFSDDDLSTRLRRGGYHTILVGRYLQANYDGTTPNGWNELSLSFGNSYHDTSRFKSFAGQSDALTQLEGDEYRTGFEWQDIQRLIRTYRESDETSSNPFFVLWTPLSSRINFDATDPAEDMIDQRNFGTRRPELSLPGGDSFNESDVTDKHPSILEREELSAEQLAEILRLRRGQILSLKSIDKAIGNLRRLLSRLQIEKNTLIVVTSNGGASLGHHRTVADCLPYEVCSHAPLIVWGRDIEPGRSNDQLWASIDLMPTILDFANAPIPRYVDGRSFRHLIDGQGADIDRSDRSSLLIQNWQQDSDPFSESRYPTTFSKLRLPDSSYVEWADGFREYYDLASDPTSLNNQYGSLDPQQQDALHKQLVESLQGKGLGLASVALATKAETIGNSKLSLKGLISASESIEAIELSVSTASDSLHWNGEGWGDLPATITIPTKHQGLQANWLYEIESLDLPAGSWDLKVTSISRDSNGKLLTESSTAVEVDATPPTTSVIAPKAGETYRGLIEFTGETEDDSRPVRAYLTLRNRDTRQFWNGIDLQDENTRVSTEIEDGSTWKYRARLPAGNYIAIIRSRDEFGNSDAEPVRVEFVVE